MNENDITAMIEALVAEERDLYRRAGDTGRPADHARLDAVRVELDRQWDLMRQYRALREAGRDPDEASIRPAGTVGEYLE